MQKLKGKSWTSPGTRIAKIIQAGANVILTTGGIDDTMMKYLVENRVIGCRRVSKLDMKRVAKAIGATVVHTMCNLSGEEVFEPEWLGRVDSVTEQRFADDDFMVIKGLSSNSGTNTNQTSSCIVLRGANTVVLDEMERAMNDALWAVSRTLESRSVVPGGGAIEMALSAYLENLSQTIQSREQLAVYEFAQALTIIPRTLALNAALDATEIIAKLKMIHHQNLKTTTQVSGTNENSVPISKNMGLNVMVGDISDTMQDGVLEPQQSKIKSFQFATEAAITILRIDDSIQLNPPKEEEGDPRMR